MAAQWIAGYGGAEDSRWRRIEAGGAQDRPSGAAAGSLPELARIGIPLSQSVVALLAYFRGEFTFVTQSDG
eukprot:scaffold66732_cov60-Phaeocystis_antarctica.AAC.1